MIDERQKDEFTDKLKRYLANPSSAQQYYDVYKSEHSEAAFEDYTRALENLVTKIETDEIREQESLCREIGKLKLPDNLFNC